ncbi:MAG: RNA polymerase sigma-70 factor [Bacteroidetes bacterium]|nr:RNA polymerase sigma-70 factor [Bacteroidota bacterium]
MEHHNENTQLEAIRQGDASAFDAVFRTYYESLCHYAAKFTEADLDEAEDVVQQAFVKLWERRTELEITHSIKAYLYKTVHNACLNRIRHLQTKSKYQQFNAGQLDKQHSYQDQTSTELQEKFQHAMESLPPQCRHIFELSRFESLKYREIADQLEISIKTVETQMGKALKLLRVQLADYLITILAIGIFTLFHF